MQENRSTVKLIAWTLVLAGLVSGGAQGLPTAEEVVGKYLDAAGGAEAIGKIKNRIEHGQVKVVEMGFSGEYDAFIAPPSHFNESRFDAIGTVQNGLTDGVSWTVNPAMGNKAEKRGEVAVLNQVLNWESRFESAE